MVISNTAFLCGHFSAAGPVPADSGWETVRKTEEEIANIRNFYFPEFVDFHTREVVRYEKPIGTEVSVPLRSGEEVVLGVKRLILWTMPSNMVIFAIETVFTDKDMDAVNESLGILRNCSYYMNSSVDAFVRAAVDPIDAIYRAMSGKAVPREGYYSHLVENGNKFKLFQIVSSQDFPEDLTERDKYLYCAGTLSRTETMNDSSVDPRYFGRVMKEHRLGVFSSWTALALLDTVTFLGNNVSGSQKEVWTEFYFGMIYIYQLFRKTFLYQHNQLFRARAEDPLMIQEELKDFERKYSFTAVSYNFLPIEVDETISKGLDIRTEEESLNKLVAEEVTAREEESSAKRDRFLLFLTCLASLSAVWDISCLLDEVINYEHTFNVANWGYRLFSSILLIGILIFAWRLQRKKR